MKNKKLPAVQKRKEWDGMRWMLKCCCVICVLLMLSVSAAADVDAAMIESMEDAGSLTPKVKEIVLKARNSFIFLSI